VLLNYSEVSIEEIMDNFCFFCRFTGQATGYVYKLAKKENQMNIFQ